MGTKLNKIYRFCFGVFILIVVGVVFFQWLWIHSVEEIYLLENGLKKSYTFDVERQTIVATDDVSSKLQHVLRKSKNVIQILTKQGVKTYLKKQDGNTYKFLSETTQTYTTPKKIAILYIATNKHITFWPEFYRSMEQYFLPKHYKTYFLFTNHDFTRVGSNVIKIHQEHESLPCITLKRYHFFEKIADQLKDFDYIYFVNGTMIATSEINEEIFPSEEQELAVTLHPGFWDVKVDKLAYDRNKKSIAFMNSNEGEHYFMGGFNGGTAKGFLKAIKKMREMTDVDLKNDVIPLWHDESILNKYMFLRMRDGLKPVILMPEYAIPESGLEEYNLSEFMPHEKIFIVDKKFPDENN